MKCKDCVLKECDPNDGSCSCSLATLDIEVFDYDRDCIRDDRRRAKLQEQLEEEYTPRTQEELEADILRYQKKYDDSGDTMDLLNLLWVKRQLAHIAAVAAQPESVKDILDRAAANDVVVKIVVKQ